MYIDRSAVTLKPLTTEFNSIDHYNTMFCWEALHPGLNGVIVIITTLWQHHSHWHTRTNILAGEDNLFQKADKKDQHSTGAGTG